MFGRWLPLLTLPCCLLLASCAEQQEERGVLVTHEGRTAMVAAAHAKDLTLFGDFSDGRPMDYYARTTTSLRQHSFTEVGADFDADIDTRGHRMVFSSTRHQLNPDLYIKGVDGVAITQLTSDPASDIQPSFSPDDTRVAFASNRAGNWDVWIMNVNGDPPIQVTPGTADEIHPSWSPDGTKLVYCSLPADGGPWELWVADATAGGTRRFIGYGLFPEWSPTSDQIVYQRARDRGSRWFSVWTITLIDGEPRFPTEIAAAANEAMILPSWSPDGTNIAFCGTPLSTPSPTAIPPNRYGGTQSARLTRYGGEWTSEPVDVWTMEADGRGKVRLTDGHNKNYAPVFAADGRVYFTTDRTGYENIWSVFPGGSPNGAEGVHAKTTAAGGHGHSAQAEHDESVITVKDGL